MTDWINRPEMLAGASRPPVDLRTPFGTPETAAVPVIVAAWDAEASLPNLMTALRMQQSFTPHDIAPVVVVDETDTSATAATAERLGAQVVTTPTRGQLSALARGIEVVLESGHQTALVTDADCRPQERWVDSMTHLASKKAVPELGGIVCGSVILHDDLPRTFLKNELRTDIAKVRDVHARLAHTVVPRPNMILTMTHPAVQEGLVGLPETAQSGLSDLEIVRLLRSHNVPEFMSLNPDNAVYTSGGRYTSTGNLLRNVARRIVRPHDLSEPYEGESRWSLPDTDISS